MADFSLTIDVEDAKVAEFLDALRWKFDNAAATPAQLKALVTANVRNDLKQVFKAYKKHLLTISPPSDEIDIT